MQLSKWILLHVTQSSYTFKIGSACKKTDTFEKALRPPDKKYLELPFNFINSLFANQNLINFVFSYIVWK